MRHIVYFPQKCSVKKVIWRVIKYMFCFCVNISVRSPELKKWFLESLSVCHLLSCLGSTALNKLFDDQCSTDQKGGLILIKFPMFTIIWVYLETFFWIFWLIQYLGIAAIRKKTQIRNYSKSALMIMIKFFQV